MKVGVLFSGGKDSTLALHLAKEKGYKIAVLISLFPSRDDSYMFHYPNIKKVLYQSKSMGIPLLYQETKGEKEKELRDLEKILLYAKKKYMIEGIVTGAIRSNYQHSRIQKIAQKINLETFNPLWHIEDEKVIDMLFERNFKVIITAVSAYPLTEKYLGRVLTPELVNELKEYKEGVNISLVGEGGEFETFVLDAPLFKYSLKIKDASISYSNYCGVYHIKRIELTKK